jgi:hypothetical protein
VSLLKEYKDLLPQFFIEMKGIKGELSDLNIKLHLIAKLIKQRPCDIDSRVK